jgi:DNA repair photolyase
LNIIEIEAKSILRKQRKIEGWFISRYGMNLYRGCSHNCVYCDGRAERYNVEGTFGHDIVVKTNAIELLSRELDPARRRVPLKPSYLFLGGGVSDSYQDADEKYRLSRKALSVFEEYGWPVHLLTKSTRVKRDIDILQRINGRQRVIVSMSFSSVDDKLAGIFEPGVPSPSDRLQTLAWFKDSGIATGMYLLPVIPHITDSAEKIEESVVGAKKAGVDFIIFGGMTLKPGRQREHFLGVMQRYFPQLNERYRELYRDDRWGNAEGVYRDTINKRFCDMAKKHGMPIRIPPSLYRDILQENDNVVVMLEHIDYLLKMRGRSSPFAYAAYSISQLKEELSSVKENLLSIKGVGRFTEKVILEILDTGRSGLLEELLWPVRPRS